MATRIRHLLLSFLVIYVLAGPAAAVPPPSERWTNDLRPISPEEWSVERAAHLLERAGFGGTPDEVEHLAEMTPSEAVNYLVDYDGRDEGTVPAFEPSGIYPNGYKLVGLDKIVLGALLTGKAYGVKATQEGALAYQPAINEFYTLLISEHAEMRRVSQAWAERMLVTQRPHQEKLTLFWHDHFATSQEKVNNYELMIRQIETLRRHANGNFRALLIAVSQDPAMLVWLDNKDNVSGKPNENFAREVMELFCMGEGQGYTEADIREIARAFTGWTMTPVSTVDVETKFIDSWWYHDGAKKTFLGRTGKFTGYDAINIILEQPATSRFLAKKLYRHFVRADIAPEVNEQLAKLLLESDYELKPLLKCIFLSRDFYSKASVGTQIKSPVHYAVSTYRKLGLSSIPGVPDFADVTGNLGQLLYYPPNVAGWPEHRSWINPSTLLARGNFVEALLLGDASSYGAPDKVVAEGYRRIPLMFRDYDIEPYVWDPEAQRMEPVTLAAYEAYLIKLDSNGESSMKGPIASDAGAGGGDTSMVDKDGMKSKMTDLAIDEKYNLAMGVYNGFIEAFRRVKPIPRACADVALVDMLRGASVDDAEAAVDYFCGRFLSVDLDASRRNAIVEFLQGQLNSNRLDFNAEGVERVLRQALHLILSSPEYQLG